MTSMKTFFVDQIGLSTFAATTLRDDHGFDSLNVFQSFSLKDIDNICQTERTPGGIV